MTLRFKKSSVTLNDLVNFSNVAKCIIKSDFMRVYFCVRVISFNLLLFYYICMCVCTLILI